MTDGERKVEYIALGELVTRLHPENPKGHDIGAIIESFKTHGYVASGVLDDRTGLFLAGHGRTQALAMMKQQGIPVPDGIRNGGNDWLVPVQTGYASKDDMHAKAYLIADNRLTTLGGWNEVMLADVLQELANSDELDIEASGYSGDDLDEILADLGRQDDPPEDPGAQIDKAAELNKTWQVKRGDVWQIGKHRIMCGDSTSAEDVGLLMGGVKADMMVTDPPYGVEYDPKWRESLEWQLVGTASGNKIINDDASSWGNAYKLFEGDISYIWHASWMTHVVAADLINCGYDVEHGYVIVWNKDLAVIGRGDYHWKHELCRYSWKKGAKHNFIGDNKETTIWDIPTIHSFANGHNADDWGLVGHATQKPIECMARPIRNHDAPIIYDPFLGSGTTIVACEQTGRVGYGMEISPDYVAVCLQRLSDMGLQPERIE